MLFIPFFTHVLKRLSCRTRVSFWSCGNKPFAPVLGWREGRELQDSIPAPCCDIRPVLVLPLPTSRICHTVLCILCSRDTRLYLPAQTVLVQASSLALFLPSLRTWPYFLSSSSFTNLCVCHPLASILLLSRGSAAIVAHSGLCCIYFYICFSS